MSNDFEFMDETVDKICESLRKEPHLWIFNPLTLEDTVSKITYWVKPSGPITERWDHDAVRVFSDKQGNKIREAYNYAQSVQASVLQKEIIDSYKIIKKDKENISNKKENKSFLKSFLDWFNK